MGVGVAGYRASSWEVTAYNSSPQLFQFMLKATLSLRAAQNPKGTKENWSHRSSPPLLGLWLLHCTCWRQEAECLPHFYYLYASGWDLSSWQSRKGVKAPGFQPPCLSPVPISTLDQSSWAGSFLLGRAKAKQLCMHWVRACAFS